MWSFALAYLFFSAKAALDDGEWQCNADGWWGDCCRCWLSYILLVYSCLGLPNLPRLLSHCSLMLTWQAWIWLFGATILIGNPLVWEEVTEGFLRNPQGQKASPARWAPCGDSRLFWSGKVKASMTRLPLGDDFLIRSSTGILSEHESLSHCLNFRFRIGVAFGGPQQKFMSWDFQVDNSKLT